MSYIDAGLNWGDRSRESLLAQVGNWFIDLVFPPVCNCGRVDYRFCSDCLNKLLDFPVDSRINTSGPLDGLASTGAYDGILGQAIRAFKYDRVTCLAVHLAERLKHVYLRSQWTVDVVLPVPLAERRLAERGYNQSELLSRVMSQQCRIPSRTDYIRRIRETDQQARLRGEERMNNVRNAFAASEAVGGLAILLIDDVVTTGSTIGECARALKAQGARAVFGLAVGRS